LSGTDYNFTSSASDKNLYINRPGGFETVFREANGTTNMIIKDQQQKASTPNLKPSKKQSIF
jgi:hypothetical protein